MDELKFEGQKRVFIKIRIKFGVVFGNSQSCGLNNILRLLRGHIMCYIIWSVLIIIIIIIFNLCCQQSLRI